MHCPVGGLWCSLVLGVVLGVVLDAVLEACSSIAPPSQVEQVRLAALVEAERSASLELRLCQANAALREHQGTTALTDPW